MRPAAPPEFGTAPPAALRWYGLSSWAFEQDELYTLRDALSLRFNVRPAYYFVVHLLLEVFPPSDLVLRGPAFVFGVLGIEATWVPGREVFGTRASGYWLVGRYNRFELMSGGGHVGAWIDAHCRTVLHTQRPRVDFRMSRVELHWCGPADPVILAAEW